ncbi:hypothetical protein [Novosphingobium sp. JCM 18896]|uniref:hypothetical protein n=1 Tax=Novosphingobium sp. JCM 18896 TaxID=2989731 RepID=UPI002221E74D|nr:hypothetical protein [Novosphingobium sp. JCM 18896]MCW1430997.1 hypothetical protein [Novosphingobium sp. JCM 18896]
MKLLRWTLAGASAYVIYKYSIGKKTKGEDVFVAPEEGAAGELSPARESAAPPKRAKPRKSAKTAG